MKVVAPADLTEGMQLDVKIRRNGKRKVVTVTVPPGDGVKRGETFEVPEPVAEVDEEDNEEDDEAEEDDLEVGQWKDGVLGCFHLFGFCHTSLWMSCCCPLIALGQVITRLDLDWTGKQSNHRCYGLSAFVTLAAVCLGRLVTALFLRLLHDEIELSTYHQDSRLSEVKNPYESYPTVPPAHHDSQQGTADLIALGLVNICYWLFLVYVLYNVR